jgi:hypothetical protein
MTNRYVLTFLHWISIVLISAILVTVFCGGNNPATNVGNYQETFWLSIIFGGVLSAPFFVASLFILPIILRYFDKPTNRILAVLGYSLLCWLGGFLFLSVSDLIDNNVDGILFQYQLAACFFVGTVVSSVYWTRIYVPANSPKRLIPDVLDAA